MNIFVIGAGYVGLSVALLLSKKNEVTIIDIDTEKVKKINSKKSPIKDPYIIKYLSDENLNIKAISSIDDKIKKADYVIVCTPTDYDEHKNNLNTSSISEVVAKVLQFNSICQIVVKSTIPIGYMDHLKGRYNKEFLFSPEFIREGYSLYDNLHPSRIVVSPKCQNAIKFSELIKNSAEIKDVAVMCMNYKEAESVKLFSNTYLAMRVAFFNELDIFAEEYNLNTKNIIDGVCADDRIGNHYNNPSFGFGGYCLPKDTKQLLGNYKGIPQNIIKSIVDSNKTRKKYLVSKIIQKKPKTVGIYRLVMKNNSDNCRTSAIFGILEQLKKNNIKINIYEPTIKHNNESILENCTIYENLAKFKKKSDLIICNRFHDDLLDVVKKVYTRDIYTRD